MMMQNTDRARVTLAHSDLWRQRGDIEENALLRLLADLCEALGPLHEQGEVHGGICPSSIGVDAAGSVYLDSACFPQAGCRPEAASGTALFDILPDGYAAFEHYMAEEAWPVGAWSDIHAISAVAYELVVGGPPDNAVKRMVAQKVVEFAENDRARFSSKLLAAITRGLSTDARVRQQTVDEFMVGLAGLTVRSIQLRSSEFAGVATALGSAGENAIAQVRNLGPLGQSEALAQDAEGFSQKTEVLSQETEEFSQETGWILEETGEPKTLAEREADADWNEDGTRALEDSAPFVLRQPEKNTAGWGMPLAVALLMIAGLGVWLFKDEGGETGHVAVAESLGADTATEAATPSNDNPSELTGENEAAAGTAGSNRALDAQSFQQAVALFNRNEPPELLATTEGAPTLAVSVAESVPEQVVPEQLVSEQLVSQPAAPALASAATEESKTPKQPTDPKAASSVNVQVNVQPWGEVFVDGASRGVSPPLRQLSLPPGTYQIRIENGDLPQARQQLIVEAGEPVRIQHVFGNREP